jgi:hypothetical protein
MKKRLTAGLLAAATATSLAAGATPAGASTASSPQPCATYPPGLTFVLTAVPARATINKGTNIAINAVLTRGPNQVPCNGYLTALRYGYAPSVNQQAKRTNSRGVAPYIATHVRSNRTYFFILYYGSIVKRSRNVGQIFVR